MYTIHVCGELCFDNRKIKLWLYIIFWIYLLHVHLCVLSTAISVQSGRHSDIVQLIWINVVCLKNYCPANVEQFNNQIYSIHELNGYGTSAAHPVNPKWIPRNGWKQQLCSRCHKELAGIWTPVSKGLQKDGVLPSYARVTVMPYGLQTGLRCLYAMAAIAKSWFYGACKTLNFSTALFSLQSKWLMKRRNIVLFLSVTECIVPFAKIKRNSIITLVPGFVSH